VDLAAEDALLGTEQIEHVVGFSSIAFYSKFAGWVVVEVVLVVSMHCLNVVRILLLLLKVHDEVEQQLVEDLSSYYQLLRVVLVKLPGVR
jgi:hypothetical protein